MTINSFPDTSLGQPKRILIVDDDPLICAMVQAVTVKHGYDVNTVNSALEMAHFMERETVDCIFLDIDLPDGDGVELLETLRIHSTVPIIMITGSQSRDLRLRALELGADDYIVKPLDQRELIARLRNILRRAYGSQSPELALTTQNASLGIAHS